MKNRIIKVLSVICSISIAISCLTMSGAVADEPVGKMSSVYAYVLNDYLFTYGAMHTDESGSAFTAQAGNYPPSGVIYGDIVNFDANKNPYLVIFFAESGNTTASCHVWKYNEEKEEAQQIAALDMNYSALPDGHVGVFSLGSSGEKRYIIYETYIDNLPAGADYYTAINGDAFEYVNAPVVMQKTGIMDFSNNYFHSGIDISYFNRTIGGFFDTLKNSAADSVTFEDIAERLSDEDEAQIEAVLKNAVSFEDFDIADYSSMDEYRNALNVPPNGDRFYLISEAYNLGDEIYYIRFSTDRSYYNYALLRRSDDAQNGYQILKVRTDCIPLSDRELKQIKTDYSRSTLLYKASKGSLKLVRASGTDDTKTSKEPMLKIEKVLNKRTRLPSVCIGGGIAVALLTLLWVYMYSDNDDK